MAYDYGFSNHFGSFGFGGVDFSFSMFSALFTIVFVAILAFFVVTIVQRIREWNKNNHAPRLTVEAELVTRRTDLFHYHHSDAGDSSSLHTSISYYVTFQVASGDRMEFQVSGREYGLLREGDRGDLSFQGTRYLGFERH